MATIQVGNINPHAIQGSDFNVYVDPTTFAWEKRTCI